MSASPIRNQPTKQVSHGSPMSETPAGSCERYPSPTAAALDSSVSQKAALKKAKRENNREKNRLKAAEAAKAKTTQVKAWETALPVGGSASNTSQETLDQRLNAAEALAVPTRELRPSRLQRFRGKTTATIPACDFKLAETSAVVEGLMASHGRWSVNFLDVDCDIFLTADKRAAISFKKERVGARQVAIVFGDPLCAPDNYGDVIKQFKDYCDANGMEFGLVGVGQDVRDFGVSQKWVTMQIGCEQMINAKTNTILQGIERPPFARRVENKPPEVTVPATGKKAPMGLVSYEPAEGGHNPELEKQAQEFYNAWSKRKGNSAHSTTITALFALRGITSYLFTKSPIDASITGLAALMKVGGGVFLLDPIIQAEDAPSSVSDFLRLAAMSKVKKTPGAKMSFGCEPLREPTEMKNVLGPGKKIARQLSKEAYDVLKFGGKHQIHSKFKPDPEQERPLYVVIASKGWHFPSLMRISKAACAASNINSVAVHRAYKEMKKVAKQEANSQLSGTPVAAPDSATKSEPSQPAA